MEKKTLFVHAGQTDLQLYHDLEIFGGAERLYAKVTALKSAGVLLVARGIELTSPAPEHRGYAHESGVLGGSEMLTRTNLAKVLGLKEGDVPQHVIDAVIAINLRHDIGVRIVK